MPDEPAVVVVVLNWNGWRLTTSCLDSLQELEYRNRRVMVVDNGSTDESVSRIEEAHPWVTLVRLDRNRGFAGGHNVGIGMAADEGADFVWLLNNDTRVEPGALRSMVREAQRDPRVGAVGCVLYRMDGSGRVQAWGGGRAGLWTGLSHHATGPVDPGSLSFLTAASLLLRTSALHEVGPLDDGFFAYWEDVDLSFRLRRAGWRLAVASDAIVWHHESATAGRRTVLGDAIYAASAKRFLRRYAPVPAIPILVALGGRVLNRARRGEWAQALAVGRVLLARGAPGPDPGG